MKKSQIPIFLELPLGDTEDNSKKVARKFADTDSPRYFRAIHSTIIRSGKRDELDRIIGMPATAAPANAIILAALLALIFWRRAW